MATRLPMFRTRLIMRRDRVFLVKTTLDLVLIVLLTTSPVFAQAAPAKTFEVVSNRIRLEFAPDSVPANPLGPGGPAGPPIAPPNAAGTASDPQGPAIFTAIQEQLGLRLESTKGQVEVVMVDSVQKPAEN